ncbi:MAG: rod-binding protein [Acetobacter sp.]|nr:rod-binding protein [Acetobacter sp.]MBR2123557.1 rod-binding protein [Acetobacter sp.]
MSVNSIVSQVATLNAHNTETQDTVTAKQREKIRQAAIDFEGMVIGEMFQPMFETLNSTENVFCNSSAEKQFRSLYVLELGKQIARHGGIGLFDSVYQQMLSMQEQADNKDQSREK